MTNLIVNYTDCRHKADPWFQRRVELWISPEMFVDSVDYLTQQFGHSYDIDVWKRVKLEKRKTLNKHWSFDHKLNLYLRSDEELAILSLIVGGNNG